MRQLALVLLSFASKEGTVRYIRSALYPWGVGSKNVDAQELGWVVQKERPDKKLEVTAGWTDEANKTTTVVLCPDETHDDLSSSIWPSSLAGCILLQSPLYQEMLLRDKTVLELGSGLGLTGMVAAMTRQHNKKSASFVKSCLLTDKNDGIVATLESTIQSNKIPPNCQVQAQAIEWRDCQNWQEAKKDGISVDVVLGTDVAYYHYLLQPLMDAARFHFTSESSQQDGGHDDGLLHFSPQTKGNTMCIVGQANRECQWTLYHNIKDGCYNQLTDQHEPPWPGQTKMLLYNLEIGDWTSSSPEQEVSAVQVIPVAALLYTTSTSDTIAASPQHYVATRQDEQDQIMCF